jgi:hypothetical protein
VAKTVEGVLPVFEELFQWQQHQLSQYNPERRTATVTFQNSSRQNVYTMQVSFLADETVRIEGPLSINPLLIDIEMERSIKPHRLTAAAFQMKLLREYNVTRADLLDLTPIISYSS